MSVDPRAGELPDPSSLIDVDALLAAYHDEQPDPSEAGQRVSFGTSGHRGSALDAHLQRGAHPRDHAGHLPTTAKREGIDGPLFLGIDTHALSEPAARDGARGPGGATASR